MAQEDVLPGHAYVPGRSPRHPDGAFDALRADARAGMTVAQLAQSTAFLTGLRFLDEGYYWEAHEVLEPVWMALPDSGPERRFVQGLIQLANGRLKLRMERPKAALRLAAMVRDLLTDSGAMGMGVDPETVDVLVVALEQDAIRRYNAK